MSARSVIVLLNRFLGGIRDPLKPIETLSTTAALFGNLVDMLSLGGRRHFQQLPKPSERSHHSRRFVRQEHELVGVSGDLNKRFEVFLGDEILGRIAGPADGL